MLFSVQKHKTQQFAKFFIKDLKTDNQKYFNENTELKDFNFSSSN